MGRHKQGYVSNINKNWMYFGVAFFLLLIILVMLLYIPNFNSIDKNILISIRNFINPYLDKNTMCFISEFGREYYMFWPQFTVAMVLISHRKYFQTYLFLFIANISYFGMIWLKNLICRPRPYNYYNGYSFPSGHAATTMCILGIVIYLILKYSSNKFIKYLSTIFFSVYILVVCITRLSLGVHYLTDVLAGCLFGFILVQVFIIIDKFLKI